MPRPRTPRDASLSRRIHYRLSPNEYTRLETEADAAGLSVHQLARERALNSRSKRSTVQYRRFDPVYIAQLKRIGNNLNQLVKSAHYFKRACPHEVVTLCHHIGTIIQQAIDEELN